MRKLMFCLLFVILFIQPVLAQDIPSLQKYVNDYANVLSASEESSLNSLAAMIEENTTVEIAIVTVDTTGDMSIEEFAVETFEKNGIGKKDKDNGLLIIAAINDRKWRFEVGYGLEPILNDAKVGLVGRTFLTSTFREERYGDGFYDAIDAIHQVIQNSGDTSFISEQISSDENMWIMIVVIIIMFFILIPIIIGFTVYYQKCPKCGARMKCHEKGEYIICECPKCKKKIKKKKKRRFFWFFFGGLGGGRSGGYSGSGGFGGGSSGGGGASGGW